MIRGATWLAFVATFVLTLAPRARADQLADTRRQRMEVARRIKHLEIQLNEWDKKEKYHAEQSTLSERYLGLKTRDKQYFTRGLEEVDSDISATQERLQGTQEVQALCEEDLRARVKALSLCASASSASSIQPSRRAAALLLRAACRRLSQQAADGRESIETANRRLEDLYETRATYDAFSQRAQKRDSSVRAEIDRNRKSRETFAALKREGQQKIKSLEREQSRLDKVVVMLQQRYAELAASKQAAEAAAPKAAEASKSGKAKPPASAKVTPLPGASQLIAAPANTPVLAAESGRVLFAGSLEGYGNIVIIQHEDEFVTVYGYLGRLAVRPDINVYRKQVVGYVGAINGTVVSGVRFEVLDTHGGPQDQEVIPPAEWAPTIGDLGAIILGKVGG